MNYETHPRVHEAHIPDFRNSYQSDNRNVEVMIVVRSHHDLNDQIYTYTGEVEKLLEDSERAIRDRDFILLGELNFLNKEIKQAHLTNNQTVRFRYLVTVSTMKGLSHLAEFKHCIQVLTEALKIRQHFSFGGGAKNSHTAEFTISRSVPVRQIPPPQTAKASESFTPASGIEKRTYRVML